MKYKQTTTCLQHPEVHQAVARFNVIECHSLTQVAVVCFSVVFFVLVLPASVLYLSRLFFLFRSFFLMWGGGFVW
jgi:hypothetical protein